MTSRAELRAGTLRLTAVAVGLVLGLSAALVLPLLFPWQGRGVLTLGTALAAAVPFGALAARLRVDAPAASLLPLGVAVVAPACVLLVLLFDVYRGQIRVINHGDEPFVLLIDGRRVARVEPSSGESSLAGVELTAPAGERELRVLSEQGRVLFLARERVEGGSPHLFAPLSAGYCFSVERRGYGAAGDELVETPLADGNPFWPLPSGINWFAPNPEPGPLHTSGGTLSSVRQKRCTH